MPRIQEDKPIQQKEIPKGKLREEKKKQLFWVGAEDTDQQMKRSPPNSKK